MLILNGKQIRKQYGEKLLFDIDDIKIYSEDKIGIVGKNGSGKSTLIKILMGLDQDIEGEVNQYGKIAYIPQLEGDDTLSLSGGEYMKMRINEAFADYADILIADEPTSNLDMDNVKYLEKLLMQFNGAVLIISHDRELLGKVCNKILEINRGQIKLYNGNYHDYEEQIQLEIEQEEQVYESYQKEKKRLIESMHQSERRASRIKKAPSRMGNSEARLHKRSAGERRSKIEGSKKAIESRLGQLQAVEKPFVAKQVHIKVPDMLTLNSQILIEGQNINKAFGQNVIFENAKFKIENNQKTLLFGGNGSGKTTLFNMIVDKEECITFCKDLKMGYYKQNLNNLDGELSILENVMMTTSRTETEVRNFLGNFLFRRADVYKKVAVISGGERVRTSFAKVFLSDINLLMLDEPTNYLDITTRQTLEEAILNYEGAILFVSHDRVFASKIADKVIYIKDKKIKNYYGSYSEFIKRKRSKKKVEEQKGNSTNKETLMVLEIRMNELINRMSMPRKGDTKEVLEEKYQATLKEIKKIKELG